jgi:hypothetical protein
MGYVVGISMLQPNNSVGFWVSGDGIGMRLDMLGATIDTGAYNNTLQVLAPIYGVQYFKMSGSQPKWKFCIKYYRRIYRQGMFMSVSCTFKLRSHVGCMVSMGRRGSFNLTR